MIVRDFVATLTERMAETKPLIQVVLGPRQVGKTTGVFQFLKKVKKPSVYVSADDTLSVSNQWIQEQWQKALEKGTGTILVLDEIQKIHNWSESLKRLWDAERGNPRIKCILLGSSSLSIQKGLTESLTGRFELIPVYHWSYPESNTAFGYDLPTYLTFGGYPGGDAYIKDYARWFSFLKSSVVDTVIGQDILTHQTVAKPALFRQAFEILCNYPAQEVSYTTLLGQLHDKGNTDLVKHYLEIYEGAYLFRGLSKYAARPVKTKGSSPKIIPLCPALYTIAQGPDTITDPTKRGHVFEAVVGADLLRILEARVFYWRDGTDEVDFVLEYRQNLFAIEVKSGLKKKGTGLEAFRRVFKRARTCFVTIENYPQFSNDPLAFLSSVAV